MSTFVVVDGILYADTQYQHVQTPMRTSNASKIHVSSDNQFVYAVSGPRVEAHNKQKTDVFCRRLVEHMICHQLDYLLKCDVKEIVESYPFGNDLCAALICTRDKTYSLVYKHETINKIGAIVDTRNMFSPVGSGSDLLSGILMTGMEIKDAYRLLNEYECFTGADPEMFTISSLDEFIVLGKPE